MSTACSFYSWVPQKHGARQSHGCVNPSFSEHGYPHASPPVTEPAQGAPRAIRGKPTTKFLRMPNHVANPPRNGLEDGLGRTHENNSANRAVNPAETKQSKCVGPCGFLGNGACPRAFGAKRARVRIKYNRADQAANPQRNEAARTREAISVPWQGCLPESVRGEACSCQDSREGGVWG